MSHTMKLWEKVIEQRLRKETQVIENQFCFCWESHLILFDLEKAYDRVPIDIV